MIIIIKSPKMRDASTNGHSKSFSRFFILDIFEMALDGLFLDIHCVGVRLCKKVAEE
jgi:hypothetical protein